MEQSGTEELLMHHYNGFIETLPFMGVCVLVGIALGIFLYKRLK